MEDQGIMALPMGDMQAPTAAPAAQAVPPELAAAIEAGRSMMRPDQVSKDTIEALGEEDPELMSRFYRMLAQMDLPPEIIDALGQMVDIILAEPQNYQQIRAELIAEGVPEELLPLEFDPAYFAALNLALDELVDAELPETPMGFADGGMVMSPIAAQLAGMGRRGDTMLAHITPSEARMLRRSGGSGTINPRTGLPEFFIKDVVKGIGRVFRGVGNAVIGVTKAIGRGIKELASSPLGRIALTVAAVYFMGPAGLNFAGTAGSITGLTGATALGVNTAIASTAVSMAGGASFKDALKSGAVQGLMAYGGATMMNADPYAAAQAAEASKAATNVGQVAPEVGPSITETVSQGVRPEVLTPTDVAALPGPSVTPEGAIQYPGYRVGPPMEQFARAAQQTATDAGGQVLPQTPEPGLLEQIGKGAKDFFSPQPSQAALDAAAKQVSGGVYENYKQAFTDLSAKNTPAAAQQLAAIQKAAAPAFGTGTRLAGTGLAALALTGGFTPKQPGRPNIIPSETGFDLLRRSPDIYGVTVGGGRTVYPGEGIMALAKGGSAKATKAASKATAKATKFEAKAAAATAAGKEEKATKLTAKANRLTAKADAFTAKAAIKSGSFMSPSDLAAGAPVGQMVNPAYAQFYEAITTPGGLRLAGGAREAGLGRYIEDRRPGESEDAYKTRFFQEATRLLTEPAKYVADPNYKAVEDEEEEEEIVKDKVTLGPTIVPPPPVVSVGGTTVPTVTVGGGVTEAPIYSPTPVTVGPMPSPLLTPPDFSSVAAAPPVNVSAPMQGAPSGMPSVSYAPAVFTSPDMYPWHTPAYATSYGLASQNNPFFPQQTQQQQPVQMARGGIAGLKEPRYFPRRNGHINGPGTGTSDDVPAMLSDGEFVFTAKAVRAAGNGSRRMGAKRMYAMMKALEKKQNG